MQQLGIMFLGQSVLFLVVFVLDKGISSQTAAQNFIKLGSK